MINVVGKATSLNRTRPTTTWPCAASWTYISTITANAASTIYRTPRLSHPRKVCFLSVCPSVYNPPPPPPLLKKDVFTRVGWLVGCVYRHIDSEVTKRRHPHYLPIAKDENLPPGIEPGPSHGSPLRNRCATQAPPVYERNPHSFCFEFHLLWIEQL